MTFATVRHRTKVAKGPGSKAAGIALAFKLIQAARERWRAVSAPRLVAARPRRDPSTTAKHGLSFFDALVMLAEGEPWMPTADHSGT